MLLKKVEQEPQRNWFAFIKDEEHGGISRIELNKKRGRFFLRTDYIKKNHKRKMEVPEILELWGQRKIFFWFEEDKEAFIEDLLETIQSMDQKYMFRHKIQKTVIITAGVASGIAITVAGIILGHMIAKQKQ